MKKIAENPVKKTAKNDKNLVKIKKPLKNFKKYQ